MDFTGKKIAISTHYLTYGPAQALRDFCVNQKIEKLFYCSHPLSQESDATSFCEKITAGESVGKKELKRLEKSFILKCLKDLFFSTSWVIKNGEKFDLFVGSDNLNALAGLILKWLGYTKKVAYYVIDYYPTRFKNKFLNYLYYKLDKFCVKHCDETWNVSGKMAEARQNKMGMDPKNFNRQYIVPIGIWFDRVQRKSWLEINRNQIVFVGHLKDEMGVDLVIRSIPKILQKIPSFEFLLIGGGDEFENLKKLAHDLGVEKYVKMTNWIKDRLQLENLMLGAAAGVAPFNVHIVDEKFYNADPAKIKDYMLMGMPVILTPVPSSAQQLKKAGCALIIDYTEDSFADAVANLLQNEEILKAYRDRAVNYIQKYDWDIIFADNLTRALSD